MRENLWIDYNKNVVETYKNGEYKELIKYAEKNIQNLSGEIVKENEQTLQILCKQGAFVTNRFFHAIEDESQLLSVYYMGMLQEIVDQLSKIQFKKIEEKSNKQYYEKYIHSIKNMDELILLLGEEKELTHSQIYEKFKTKIVKSTLSEFLAKAEDANIVNNVKHGRFKYCSLTDTGKKIYIQMRKNEQEENRKKREHEYMIVKSIIKEYGVKREKKISLQGSINIYNTQGNRNNNNGVMNYTDCTRVKSFETITEVKNESMQIVF